MEMNPDKCHFFTSGIKFEHLWAKIGKNSLRPNSNNVPLLGCFIVEVQR